MHHLDTFRPERSRTRSVLVAVDCQADTLDATAWAAAEASARQAKLRLLHVIPWSPFGPVPLGPGDDKAHDTAQRLLDRAAQQARQVAPHLVVTTDVHSGDPGHAIAIAGDDADLIVLGREAISRSLRQRGRSVILRVTTTARRPVAVVGFNGLATYGRAAGRVVAVLPHDRDVAAAWAVLGAAFTAAEQRGVAVTALVDPRTAGSPSETSVTGLLRQHLHAFVDVDLQVEAWSDPCDVLLPQAARSAALVVFAVPETRVARWRSRSTIARLLETIPAPITFVRPSTSHLLASRPNPLDGRHHA